MAPERAGQAEKGWARPVPLLAGVAAELPAALRGVPALQALQVHLRQRPAADAGARQQVRVRAKTDMAGLLT